MANLDSRSKRASSVGILLVSVLSPVLPDGTIAQGDRQHVAWSYSGIAAAAPDIEGPPYYITGSLDPALYLTGSLTPTLTFTGSLEPTLNLTGSV
jgi:hypothetical protein